ncbi:MAG: galactose-1-phosphate uridylyltransferase [Prosthecobacter sp.]|nr:galactose-1-phosphate uridylyltransferase [Prosthecobacter sp.]
MPEMRYNPITLDWVIMAPERELRPSDFPAELPNREERPAHREGCPFCVGNEHSAPPEICRASAADGSWTVRVIPNKFSVFATTDDLCRVANGTFRSMAAAGSHEVVVEHPNHSLSLEDMTPAHLAVILGIFRERYQALRQNPNVESIVIFKNHGQRAGSSLTHSHSQITAAPILSSQVCMRLQEARRFHELNGGCLYCQVIQDELLAQERIIEAGSSFVAFAPYASLSPYHLWIFPRRHASSFDAISDEDIVELAGVLSRVLRRLAKAAGGPDYNFTIRSSPVSECSTQYFHWYLAIVPRMNQLAGFELGSGTYINNLCPERCAERLRSVVVES